jgi:hypothetical protein
LISPSQLGLSLAVESALRSRRSLQFTSLALSSAIASLWQPTSSLRRLRAVSQRARCHACKIWATDTKRFCLNPIHDTLGLYTLGTHDQKKNHETYMGSTGIIEFRYRSWLCENAGTRNGERRSYSSEAASGFQLASAFNLIGQLKNVILIAFRCSAFSHSRGHSLPKWAVHPTSFPPIATKLRTSLMARFVPMSDITLMHPPLKATIRHPQTSSCRPVIRRGGANARYPKPWKTPQSNDDLFPRLEDQRSR